ncbi:DUF4352 domain-containing protein [Arthrobacter sp.]|uniref:DUF4352 domain-containing protein n=1 Tax=Arthrobacter sp. TaxID=1667 RepID=UPI003A94F795
MSVENPIAPAPQAPAPAPKSNAGKVLGIAALIVAIVALLLCWVPIINNFAALLGFVSLVLGIVSLVIAAKRHGGKGLGLAATIISVVAIVMVFVTQAAYVAAIDSVSSAVEDAADGEVAAPAEVVKQAADTAQVLDLGQTATVGSYQVAVTSVDLNGATAIASANEFNDKAKGQYVLADLSVTYQGDKEGTAWIDLQPELVGSDSRIYDSSTCMAMTSKPISDVPDLTRGGSASYQVCFDVPKAALKDAKLRVSDVMSFSDDEAALWATR